MQSKMKLQKDSEMRDQREKYERMIEELKRTAANEREFLKKEMQNKIDDLERQI